MLERSIPARDWPDQFHCLCIPLEFLSDDRDQYPILCFDRETVVDELRVIQCGVGPEFTVIGPQETDDETSPNQAVWTAYVSTFAELENVDQFLGPIWRGRERTDLATTQIFERGEGELDLSRNVFQAGEVLRLRCGIEEDQAYQVMVYVRYRTRRN